MFTQVEKQRFHCKGRMWESRKSGLQDCALPTKPQHSKVNRNTSKDNTPHTTPLMLLTEYNKTKNCSVKIQQVLQSYILYKSS